jgi:hypothetical protein
MAGDQSWQNKAGIRWDFAPASHASTCVSDGEIIASLNCPAARGSAIRSAEITSPKGKRMADTRLNGIIRALESGRPAFTCFSPPEVDSAYAISVSKYDGVVWEMEHNPWDGRALRDTLQYMLNRGQIVKSARSRPPSRRWCAFR